MALNVNDIIPKAGVMHCNLWENSNINLPLTLFYSIEIPLEPFDSGHTYNTQSTETSLVIECILFRDQSGHQEKNWTRLLGRHFQLSFDDGTADGSVYLGTEHCQLEGNILFYGLQGSTFEVELQVKVDYNIETVNLPDKGFIKLKTKVDFQGLLLYPVDSLPTFKDVEDPMTIVRDFIHQSVYEISLVDYDVPDIQWKQLKPRY